ncbi:MAG TPA: GAF domain-containing protein [Thermoanaerobaculia bacterium]
MTSTSSELEQIRVEARELTAIARVAASARDVEEVLPEVCRRAAQLCGADRGTIFLWGDNSKDVYPASSELPSGQHEESFWRRLQELGRRPLNELRLISRLASTRQSVHIDDARGSPMVNQDSVAAFGLCSIFGVPLVAGDDTIGALLLDRREVRPFTERQRELAVAVADHVAVVLQKALMLEKTRRQLRQTEALLEISRSLSSTLELRPLLKKIAKQAARAGHMERCSIYLLDGDRVIPVMSQFADGRVDQPLWDSFLGLGRMRFDEIPFLAEAVSQRAPVVIDDPATDPRVPANMAVFAFRSLLTVPLVRHDEVLGAMALDNTDQAQAIHGEQVALASTIGSQLALVLDNVRHYERAQAALAELRETQERLVQGEKYRALAEMAGGVAHDFNNLLTAILGRTQVLIRVIEAGAFTPREGRHNLAVIEQAARDGAETVRRLLEFTRATPRPEATLAVDVNEELRHTREVTRPRWKDEAEARGIALDVVLELGEVPRAASHPAELREVLLNLTVNALEAMPEGGTLTLASRNSGNWVCLEVRDTGVGMPLDVRQRIFDPFFTTKGPGSSGLGLSVSYGILRRHGGEILVDSQPGRGTVFTLRLPRHVRQAPARETPAPAVDGRRLRVLVVDDEAPVREVLGEILASGGHEVLQAASGRAGLELLELRSVDLVITDLGMPGMNGWEVAERVKGRWPQVKIGLISGWGPQVDPAELTAHGVDFLCSKPFEVAEILSTLATL